MRRRTLLRGAGGLGLAVLAGCSAPAPALPAPTVTDSRPNRPVNVEYVRSRARGRKVRLVVMRPAGEPDAALPVCVALHGRGSDARMFVQLGVPDLLTQVNGEGAPPFAMVSLDGGNDYWVARDRHDDPQRMLTDAGRTPSPATRSPASGRGRRPTRSSTSTRSARRSWACGAAPRTRSSTRRASRPC